MIVASLSPATGPLVAAAVLLAGAGVAKLQRPAPTGLALARAGLPGSDLVVRTLGHTEITIAIAAALLGGWLAAPLALAYLGFAAFTALQVRRAAAGGEAADCGCFGDHSAPLGWTHVAINLALAGAAVLAVATSAAGVIDAGSEAPGATVAVIALAVVAAFGVRALLTDLPALTAAQVTPARGTF